MAEKTLKTNDQGCKPVPAEQSQTLTLTPPVDIYETEHEFVIQADVPGVAAGEVDLRFENGELSILGRKSKSARDNSANSYFRSFRVSEKIAADKIEADLKNGVLTLKLPKIEAVKPRKIAVKG